MSRPRERIVPLWYSKPPTLEKEMAIHSSILAWRVPWMEELGGLQSMELQRVGHDWVTNAFTFFFFFTCCVSCLVPSFLVWVETPLAWPASYHSQICPCRCTQSSHLHYFPYSLLFYMITGTPPVGWNHRPRVKEETWHEDIVRVKVCLFSCQGTDWLHVLFCRFLSGTWDPFHSLAALIDKHQPWNLQPTYFW